MSKKKGQQKKQIIPIFQRKPFWQYLPPSAQTNQKVDTFINTFNTQLKALIDPSKSFQQNYQLLADKMKCQIHPCLTIKEKKQDVNFPALQNNDYGQKFVIFLGHKIDMVTIKLFGFLFANYKLNSLKISNNSLGKEEAAQFQKILQKDDSLATLFFQWNTLENYEKKKQFILNLAKPHIQHLILRQCKIGDEICKQLIAKIKAFPDGKMKSLDLYGNQITAEIKDDICQFIEQNKVLQFIGLSKNKLGQEKFLSQLFNSIGQIPLTEQQYEGHKAKQKARDQIIEKNKKKKKGAPDQPVPFVLQVKQTEAGRFYVKNTSLKILNLSSNNINDKAATKIRNFAQKQGKNVEVFLQNNKLSKKSKETLKFFANLIV